MNNSEKEKNFISAVIYVNNAQDRIEDFLRLIAGVLEENFEHSEIICVDDYSKDDSCVIIKKVSEERKHTSITLLHMSYFHGVEGAMTAGDDLSIGDFVLEFDSCVQDFDPDEIMRVYRTALEGADIVSASPDRKQKLSSSLFYHFLERYTDLSQKVCSERFRILSRRVFNRIDSMNNSVPYRKAVYAGCGLKMVNLRYPVTEKKASGISGKRDRAENKYRADLAVDTLILFTDIGYSFSMVMTLAMMVISIIMAAYSVAIYLGSNPVEGWTTTILFLSAAFFGLFGILTIIIKYLQILLKLVFRRKQYSFLSIEKLT